MPNHDDDAYSDAEAARRRDEVVKRMLATPPQPRKPPGQGKAEKPGKPRPERKAKR